MRSIRKLTLLLCIALIIAAFTAVPASAASKGKLIKEHKFKASYLKKGKWTTRGIKYNLDVFKYSKKGDLASITHKVCRSKSNTPKTSYVDKFKLKYKSGKLYKRSFTEESYSEATYYKKGVPYKFESSDDDGVKKGQLSYKARYLSKETVTKTVSSEEYGDPDSPSVTTTVYTVKTKNGYPVKISSADEYGNKTVVTFYTKGSKKGLVKKVVESDESGYRIEHKYSYKIKGGLVKSYTEKAGDDYKVTGSFKYTKKKATDKRYRSMINDILCDYVHTYW